MRVEPVSTQLAQLHPYKKFRGSTLLVGLRISVLFYRCARCGFSLLSSHSLMTCTLGQSVILNQS